MKKLKLFILILLIAPLQLSAFEKGFTLGLKALFSGSYTDPHIGQADKDYLGAQFMRGMVGFVVSGEAELTYIFDAKRYFNYQTNNTFSGLGLSFNLGVGQGFSGQISGSYNEGIAKNIEVYCRVYMTPIVTFGTAVKAMFFQNRFALGFGLGGKMLADPQPTYELYTNLNEEQLKMLKQQGFDFYSETGTLYIPEAMMKKMNPLGLVLKTSLEYNQPVISRMDITIGAYMSYTVYKPGYVSLPKKLMENAKKVNNKIDFENDKLKSFYMNNVDFGISLGLLFKV